MWLDLLKTWLVEIPLLLLFLWRYDQPVRIVLLSMLIGASTWPFLIYYYSRFGGNIYLLEGLVSLVESIWIWYLWKPSWPYSLLVGFACNALSFSLGWFGLI